MILPETKLPKLRRTLSAKRIVFTIGSFDLLHVGHISYLAWCAEQGDVLVVGVNHDQGITRDKGSTRPIVPQQERLRMVDALRSVDFAVLTEANTGVPYDESIQTAKKLQPNIVILTHDYGLAESPYWEAALPSTRVVICYQRWPGRSTTKLVSDIVGKHGDAQKC